MMFKRSLVIILISLSYTLLSQEKEVLEFNNRPVNDVLLVLGELTGKNLIIDETVTGLCSYYFSTENIEEAFNIFLKSQNLIITKLDSAYKVSKIDIEIDKDLNIRLNCIETDIKAILDRIMGITGITILYDTLPERQITLNIKSLKLSNVLEIIIKKFPEYILENNPNYLYIKKHNQEINERTISDGITLNSDGLYSIKLHKIRFSQVIGELFNKSNIEYSIQGRNDNIIDILNFKNKTFNELLNLILESGNCDYVLSNDIYYIFDITKNEIENRHIETIIIKLKHLTVNELLKLIPGNFISNNVIKADESNNSLIIYGTKIKITPIIDFIKLVDVDTNLKPRWIKMNFITSDLFKTLLFKSYNQSSIINVDEKSFIILLNDKEFKDVIELKNTIDIPTKSFMITLKYLKSDELIKTLPKSVDSKSIVLTDNPSVLFFYGENESYKKFIEELEKIDKPVPQIKYKILVLQNTIGDNSSFGFEVNSHSEDNGDITLPEDDWSAFSGALGSLLNLNFNVLSAFGALFSFELNAAIQESRTKVLVDTTLQGLSGNKVSFRNTTTSRFYQSTTDVDGESETGATQEVSWGIILDIEGWVSGDGMVTVNVESTISDETTVSGESSGIPSTSEKIVTTEVRTREGVPVVIGGLLSSKKEISQEKTPILGDIPILKYLFTKDIEFETQSEFIIYLIPYIDNEHSENFDSRIENVYMGLLKNEY